MTRAVALLAAGLLLVGCGSPGGLSEDEAYSIALNLEPGLTRGEFRDLADGLCDGLDTQTATYMLALAMDDGKPLAEQVALNRAMTEYACPGKTKHFDAAFVEVSKL